MKLPYFNDSIIITKEKISKANGAILSRWEQVFLYNHMAQGGRTLPTGKWKGFVEFPNTVSKVKSMKGHVEDPLIDTFKGRKDALLGAGLSIGGQDMTHEYDAVQIALFFRPLPRVPVMLLFWDRDKEEGFNARVKLMFDETVTDHLDIESIVFLSETLKDLLCDY